MVGLLNGGENEREEKKNTTRLRDKNEIVTESNINFECYDPLQYALLFSHYDSGCNEEECRKLF